MSVLKAPLDFLKIAILCLVMQALPALAADGDANPETMHVFLAGNSIFYTNNLPAILTEIGSANGKRIRVDMFARGGAQISDLLDAGVVRSALENNAYDAVIFHDRGGDAFCAASTETLDADCRQMIDDHRRLANLIRKSGSVPHLLGTYQPSFASLRLTQGERRIAEAIGVNHIEISEKWHTAKEVVPEAPWLAEDGMHPGKALSILMAVEIYRTIYGDYPRPIQLSTTAPLYVPRDKLAGIVVQQDLPAEEMKEVLPMEEFAGILAALRRGGSGG